MVTTGLVDCVDEVKAQCEICRAADKAPQTPIAGTPTASTFSEKLQTDLFFEDYAIALRAMDPYSKCPHLVPVRSGTLRRYAMCFAARGLHPNG